MAAVDSGVQVVVKHTFWEVDAVESSGSRPTRVRALTDSCILATQIEDDLASTVASDGEASSPTSGSRSGESTPSIISWEDDEIVSVSASASTPPGAWLPIVHRGPSPPSKTTDSDNTRHRWPPQARSNRPASADSRTTLMLRNLPSCFSRQDLLTALDAAGFGGDFDFAYLPVDFHTGAGLGYAFLNAVNHDKAAVIMKHFQGFAGWSGSTSHKVLEVCWSDPHQGLDMLIERYRNSRIMHGSVPDEYKPVLFSNGQRIPFPRHTKRIRAPVPGGPTC